MDFALAKRLKEAGFPQGGQGFFVNDFETGERAYVPRPEELYAQFIADPDMWDQLRNSLAEVWIQNAKK